MNTQEQPASGSGLSGSVKVIAAMVILAVATLAVLLVLGVIPVEFFGEMSVRILLLALIGVAAAGALWVVMRAGRANR